MWRQNDNAASDACGRDGQFQYGVEITIEFKLTGGEVYYDTQSEGAGGDRIVSSARTGDVLSLELADRHPAWKIRFTAADKADFSGQVYTRCTPAEPRANIKLARDDMRYLATGLIPSGTSPFYGVYFVDGRDAGGCKAKLFQALGFDLRSPAFPALARFESMDVGARLGAHKKPGVVLDTDGMGRWLVDGVQPDATGWRFTLIELIPPNGSRGDSMTLDVMRTKTGISIPAWKRSYIRCVFS